MSFNPNNDISDQELLYRIIRPFPDHWNFEENRFSSGAFKSSLPISVDRDGNRQENDIINFFWNFHSINSGVAKLSVLECKGCDTTVTAKPLKGNKTKLLKANPFHAEINGRGIIGTKGSHGNCLNKKAIIIKYPHR